MFFFFTAAAHAFGGRDFSTRASAAASGRGVLAPLLRADPAARGEQAALLPPHTRSQGRPHALWRPGESALHQVSIKQR